MTNPKRPEADTRMQAQCWICPKCHDDHSLKAECTPMDHKPFIPTPDDTSYIAIEYRKLLTRVEELEALLRQFSEDKHPNYAVIPKVHHENDQALYCLQVDKIQSLQSKLQDAEQALVSIGHLKYEKTLGEFPRSVLEETILKDTEIARECLQRIRSTEPAKSEHQQPQTRNLPGALLMWSLTKDDDDGGERG